MSHKVHKKALITGITGQDGSYLAEFLLNKGYEVHGIIRRVSSFNTERINHIYVDPHKPESRFFLYHGDLSDSEQISNIIYNIKPDEIYHLAAQSHVRVSFDIPEYTANITALGTTRILEAIRRSGLAIKFYQASSAEMFSGTSPSQGETFCFDPKSPYACSKAYAYWMTKIYREGYKIFVCNGILFNHESPRRGETFVTRKITRAVAAILAKKQDYLYLGNLKSRKDWGYAPEYVEMMWRILQQKSAEDFVLGTGSTHSVQEFMEKAFAYAGLDWKKYVKIDSRYFRPTETEEIKVDCSKARRRIKWDPLVSFDELVKIMMDTDMRHMGLKPVGEGDSILKEKFPNRWWMLD